MTETMEELELIPATRSPHGYLASFLSDNIAEKEDGTLIVVGCPVARTGWQKYTVGDLPQELAKELGVDVSNPSASIELYRPAKEVFAPEFLASLNGCAITDGHPPDGQFVDPKNFNKYAMGHIQNVRKGLEPMEDGEWPIIADLHISAEPLISKVRNKVAREISLGYDFSINRDGDKICQVNMIGNHNAVVPKGRAGDLIRISDAEPASLAEPVKPSAEAQTSSPIEAQPAQAEVIEAKAYPLVTIPFKSIKEKHPVSTKNKLLRLFMGKHLIEMARASDADPEKIMEAAEALNEPEAAPAKDDTDANEFKSADRKPAKDKRKAMHDALDKMLDGEEDEDDDGLEIIADRKRGKDKRSKDADIEELKGLLDEFLGEEAEAKDDEDDSEDDNESDVEDADTSGLEAVLGGEGEDCPDCGEAMDEDHVCDDASDPGEEEVESGEEELEDEEGGSPDPDSDDDQSDVEDKRKASDRARAADAAMETLRLFRPYAARTTDKAFKAAFNKALDSVKKTSRTSNGSYGKFAKSASARDGAPRKPASERMRAADGSAVADTTAKLQDFYNNAIKGGK